MVDSRLRRERLFDLLPSVYAAQPHTSVVRLVIDALADQLSAIDVDLQRILRDRWWALANGVRGDNASASMLERLGALLDLPRMRWQAPSEAGGGWETDAAYRRRLHASATVMRRGLCTPQQILAMCAAALDCSVDGELRWDSDTTIMRTAPRRGGIAPQELWLTDCPLTRHERKFVKLKHDDPFTVRNPGMLADYPVITLTAGDRPVFYPALYHHQSREMVVYAGVVPAGGRLTIRGPVEHEGEVDDPFTNYDSGLVHPWAGHHPFGHASLDGADVSDRIWYLHFPARFDRPEVRFVDLAQPVHTPMAFRGRFEDLQQTVRVPVLSRGIGTWCLRSLSAARCRLLGIPADAAQPPPADPALGGPDLKLSWWTRRPAHVRIRIRMTPYLTALLERGQSTLIGLLGNYIERARPAGVSWDLDFPRELERSALEPAERLRLSAGEARRVLDEPTVRSHQHVQHSARAPLRPGDRLPVAYGRHDVTRFGHSLFAQTRLATCDESDFDRCVFDDFLGAFDLGRFDRNFFTRAKDEV